MQGVASHSRCALEAGRRGWLHLPRRRLLLNRERCDHSKVISNETKRPQKQRLGGHRPASVPRRYRSIMSEDEDLARAVLHALADLSSSAEPSLRAWTAGSLDRWTASTPSTSALLSRRQQRGRRRPAWSRPTSSLRYRGWPWPRVAQRRSPRCPERREPASPTPWPPSPVTPWPVASGADAARSDATVDALLDLLERAPGEQGMSRGGPPPFTQQTNPERGVADPAGRSRHAISQRVQGRARRQGNRPPSARSDAQDPVVALSGPAPLVLVGGRHIDSPVRAHADVPQAPQLSG